MKIGVFDSGVGGLSVARAIEAAFPEHEVIFRSDAEHMPYATRPPKEILAYSLPVLRSLIDEDCRIIVIACNTVSTTILNTLREKLPVPLIGVEPMLKEAAAATKSQVITVCATPATLASKRYHDIKQQYAADLTVIEPDCSDWSYLIEHEQIDEQRIADSLESALHAGADVIVLGCTHYHWIEEEIMSLANGRAIVLHPEQIVIEELRQALEQLL